MSTEHLDQLIEVFEQPTTTSASVLGGRTSTSNVRLNGLGNMVVKHYRRGGWVRRIVEDKYLRWGSPRCRIEFDMLLEVRRYSVVVPEPIAFACQGHVFYRCWLVMRQIPSPQNLAEMSRVDLSSALAAVPSVADQIRRLIQHGIWHVDLHPGNVLVDPRRRTYLIDFDRAKRIRSAPSRLQHRYLRRWRRAVEKHGLPLQLAQQLETGLRSIPSAGGLTNARSRRNSSGD
jgi:RIO-like serine/threonine protein kinase